SAYWTDRALDFIRSQPISWLTLLARKLALTVNAAEIADTETPLIYQDWSWLLRILRPFDFGALLALAALGLALTGRRLWLLYAMAATYPPSVALFYVFARYRFPLVPILILIATAGLLEAWDRLKRREYRVPAIAGAAALAALLFAHIPFDNAD